MLVDGSWCVNRLEIRRRTIECCAPRHLVARSTYLVGKERGCEKTCSRAISEGTQNAWTEQRGQAAILAGKR